MPIFEKEVSELASNSAWSSFNSFVWTLLGALGVYYFGVFLEPYASQLIPSNYFIGGLTVIVNLLLASSILSSLLGAFTSLRVFLQFNRQSIAGALLLIFNLIVLYLVFDYISEGCLSADSLLGLIRQPLPC